MAPQYVSGVAIATRRIAEFKTGPRLQTQSGSDLFDGLAGVAAYGNSSWIGGPNTCD